MLLIYRIMYQCAKRIPLARHAFFLNIVVPPLLELTGVLVFFLPNLPCLYYRVIVLISLFMPGIFILTLYMQTLPILQSLKSLLLLVFPKPTYSVLHLL